MADNAYTPFGFRAVKNDSGTAPLIKTYDASIAQTLYSGMPVMFNVSGLVVAWTMTAATIGSCIGVTTHGRKPADVARTISVYAALDQEYEVMLDDNSIITVANMLGTGKNRYTVAEATLVAGNGTTLQSKAELDASSQTSLNVTTSIAPFIVLGWSPIQGQDTTGAYARVICRIAEECMFFYKTV